jgi:predicted RNase H-like HicB family nuclease
MQYIYEALIEPVEDGQKVTFPNWEGLTAKGSDYAEAVKVAAQLLTETIGDYLQRREPLPEATFGAEVPEGARAAVIAVDALPSSVSLLLTASDASAVLGVTRSRISNMLRAGILEEGHRDGRSTVVTLKSVNQRLMNPRRPGRPKKNQ